MRLSHVELLDEIREIGRQLMTTPERFTGNVRVSCNEGGITSLTVEASVHVGAGGPDPMK